MRTRDEKRTARLTVMSGAYELFKTRRSNIARRDPQMARAMRWAGQEARFCIAEYKNRSAWDAQQKAALEHIKASQRDLISRMTPEQREDRKRQILADIDGLVYRPLSVNIRAEREKLQDELETLKEFDPPVEPINRQIIERELVESLEGRTEPSPELVELRERAKLGTASNASLAITAAIAARVL